MKNYRVVSADFVKNKEELAKFMLWFLNIHPFSEKLYLSVPDELKKYFEENKGKNE